MEQAGGRGGGGGAGASERAVNDVDGGRGAGIRGGVVRVDWELTETDH